MRFVIETGKPIAQVARDLGIHAGTLDNWVSAERGGEGALDADERAGRWASPSRGSIGGGTTRRRASSPDAPTPTQR